MAQRSIASLVLVVSCGLSAFASSAAASAAAPAAASFEAWARAHARAYASPAAEAAARAAFAANAARVVRHELERAAGRATHSLALNKFADVSAADFAAAALGLPLPPQGLLRGAAKPSQMPAASAPLPDGVDWLARGFVPPVKNSGACADGGTLAFTDSVSAAGGILADVNAQNARRGGSADKRAASETRPRTRRERRGRLGAGPGRAPQRSARPHAKIRARGAIAIGSGRHGKRIVPPEPQKSKF